MEYIALRPPRHGLKVYYPGQATIPAGAYTVIATDDYDMTGYVTIQARDKRITYLSASELTPLVATEEYQAARPLQARRGITTLPPVEALVAAGFQLRAEEWRIALPLHKRSSLHVAISATPTGAVHGVPYFSYLTEVSKKAGGRPKLFGRLRNSQRKRFVRRISQHLGSLEELDLQLFVNPRDYGWKSWPASWSLCGAELDEAMLKAVVKGRAKRIIREHLKTSAKQAKAQA